MRQPWMRPKLEGCPGWGGRRAGWSQSGRPGQGLYPGLCPFDGVVLSTLAEVGDLAGPGRPVLTFCIRPKPCVVVQVPASQSGSLKRATQIAVDTPKVA